MMVARALVRYIGASSRERNPSPHRSKAADLGAGLTKSGTLVESWKGMQLAERERQPVLPFGGIWTYRLWFKRGRIFARRDSRAGLVRRMARGAGRSAFWSGVGHALDDGPCKQENECSKN